jgi:hypothetical protein
MLLPTADWGTLIARSWRRTRMRRVIAPAGTSPFLGRAQRPRNVGWLPWPGRRMAGVGSSPRVQEAIARAFGPRCSACMAASLRRRAAGDHDGGPRWMAAARARNRTLLITLEVPREATLASFIAPASSLMCEFHRLGELCGGTRARAEFQSGLFEGSVS